MRVAPSPFPKWRFDRIRISTCLKAIPVVVVLSLIGGVACQSAPVEPTSPAVDVTALTNARVIDGNGDAPLEQAFGPGRIPGSIVVTSGQGPRQHEPIGTAQSHFCGSCFMVRSQPQAVGGCRGGSSNAPESSHST